MLIFWVSVYIVFQTLFILAYNMSINKSSFSGVILLFPTFIAVISVITGYLWVIYSRRKQEIRRLEKNGFQNYYKSQYWIPNRGVKPAYLGKMDLLLRNGGRKYGVLANSQSTPA